MPCCPRSRHHYPPQVCRCCRTRWHLKGQRIATHTLQSSRVHGSCLVTIQAPNHRRGIDKLLRRGRDFAECHIAPSTICLAIEAKLDGRVRPLGIIPPQQDASGPGLRG
jgi:hypothetical protein